MRLHFAAPLATLLLCAVAHAQAPAPLRLGDAVACAECRIALRPISTLSSATIEGEIVELPLGVRRDSRGNIWVLSSRSAPRLFDEKGQFQRTLGRVGAGPNEYSWVEDIFWTPEDSMVIVDSGNQRATVLAPSGEVVRTVRLPVQMVNTMVDTWPRRVIASGHVASPQAAGLPLRVMDLSGSEAKIVRSFGPDNGLLRPGRGGAAYHFLVRSAGRPLLSMASDRYRVLAWGPDLRQQWSLVRSSAWFPDTGAGRMGTPDRAPTPGINGVALNDGVLWVFSRVAAPTWKSAWGKIAPGTREVFRSQIDFPALFQTRIEAIDIERRVLLARLDVPGFVISTLPDGLVSLFRKGYGPDAQVEIARVVLSRTSARR